ncbi:hypothetical protein ABMA27_001746 [Loxostege sticticalis]|uniref:Sugar transporter n=1 Tax=Loxostege sticticalis TaxID=481309 RepID=A0ABR3HZK4_LOXSC
METEYRQIEQRGNTSWTHFFRQVLVALILWTFFINAGLVMGTITVAIPQLRKEANSTEAVSNEMASWLSSTAIYSASINIFITIPFAHFIGRKFTMTFLAVSTFIVAAIMYFSKTAMHLLICQLLLGMSVSANGSVFLLILSEYSSPKYRGVFLTIKSATFFWGMWIANAIGIFTKYQYTGLVGMFCSGYSIIITLIIPESPYWLAFKGRYDECAVAHRWLKGVDEDAETELEVLIKSQKENDQNVSSVKSLRKYLINCLTAVKQPEVYKPLLLCCLVASIYSLSGKLVCAMYAIEMMKKITENQSTVYIGVLILDGFTVLGMYVGCGLSKILKRRTLLLSTSITATTFLFAMLGYSISVCCGPMILSTSISAELLPMRCRSVCVFLYSVLSLTLMSTILKVSPYVFNSYGFHGAYLCFGICSTIVITLMYKYVPETKDRTLHEISEMFKPKLRKKVTQ